MKCDLFTKSEGYTEEADQVSHEFCDLIRDFIVEKSKTYSTIELEHIMMSDLALMFCYERLGWNKPSPNDS